MHETIWRTGLRFLKQTFGDKEIIGAEIGVCKGENALEMYQNLNFKKMYLIDLWEIYFQDKQRVNYTSVYDMVKDKFKEYNDITIIKGDSIEIAKTIEDNVLDFAYIDANHQKEYVVKDMEAWLPKVKVGGYLMGHDYGGIYTGVKEAVDEFINKFNYKLLNKIPSGDWWFQK